MDAHRRTHPADPDFDSDPGHPPGVRLRDFDPAEHHRVVVNPFLAVVGLVGLGRAALGLFGSSIPPTAVLAVFPLAGLPYLLQYLAWIADGPGPWPGSVATPARPWSPAGPAASRPRSGSLRPVATGGLVLPDRLGRPPAGHPRRG